MSKHVALNDICLAVLTVYITTNSTYHHEVGTASRLWNGRSGFEFRHGREINLFSKIFRPLLGPTKSPIKLVPPFYHGFKTAGSVMVTSDLHVVPKLRISGSIPLSSYALMVRTRNTLTSAFTTP